MLEKLVWTPVVILLTVPWVGLHCCIFFFFFFFFFLVLLLFLCFFLLFFLCVDGLYVDSHLVCLHNIGI